MRRIYIVLIRRTVKYSKFINKRDQSHIFTLSHNNRMEEETMTGLTRGSAALPHFSKDPAEYQERIVAHARRACGSGAPEDKVLKAAIYYAVKWTGLSEREARRIFIDNEPPRQVTLDDLNPEVRDWLLSFDKKPVTAR